MSTLSDILLGHKSNNDRLSSLLGRLENCATTLVGSAPAAESIAKAVVGDSLITKLSHEGSIAEQYIAGIEKVIDDVETALGINHADSEAAPQVAATPFTAVPTTGLVDSDDLRALAVAQAQELPVAPVAAPVEEAPKTSAEEAPKE